MILSYPYSGTRFRIIFFREQARARLSNRMKKKLVLAALELVGDGVMDVLFHGIVITCIMCYPIFPSFLLFLLSFHYTHDEMRFQ